MIEQLLLIE